VTLIVGVNGTGKTTTVGKLANLLKSEGRMPLICAADTFRAAAVEQLEIWPAALASTWCAPARAPIRRRSCSMRSRRQGPGRDPILIDTAGRLHTRVNLMNELDKIRRVASREIPGAPHEVLLVLDATVGQNGLAQAREFMGVAGVNGNRAGQAGWHREGRRGGGDRERLEAADSLRRRRRGDRRSGPVLGGRVRERPLREKW